jgi:hypothetical protein
MDCVFGFDYCASGLLEFSVSGSNTRFVVMCAVCYIAYRVSCTFGLPSAVLARCA